MTSLVLGPALGDTAAAASPQLPADAPPGGLFISGICHDGDETVLLLSPDGAGFWDIFTATPEYRDGLADPMDRWSRRVIAPWGATLGGRAILPSDGPPYAPFYRWAVTSGRFWSSPVGMLVHDRMGLWASFRGAVILPRLLPLRRIRQPAPCVYCTRPCLTACPAGAFQWGYDVAACHAWLDGPQADDCKSSGCNVRRACPISAGCGRLPEQSAWHMRAFHS